VAGTNGGGCIGGSLSSRIIADQLFSFAAAHLRSAAIREFDDRYTRAEAERLAWASC
jgi:hypothetical protein